MAEMIGTCYNDSAQEPTGHEMNLNTTSKISYNLKISY